MIVACSCMCKRVCLLGGSHSCTCKRACLLGGSGGMLPQENFEFRSSQIASDAIWDKIVV